MNKREKIVEELSKELTENKGTRINIRVSDDLHEKLLKFKKKSGVSISDVIRISLIKYFVENEIND